MIYDHIVKLGNTYYNAGENVPEIGLEPSPVIYTDTELREMTAKEIRNLAAKYGITLKKVLKEDLVQEFLTKYSG